MPEFWGVVKKHLARLVYGFAIVIVFIVMPITLLWTGYSLLKTHPWIGAGMILLVMAYIVGYLFDPET